MYFKTTFALAMASLCQPMLCAQTLSDVVISATRSEQRSFDALAAISVVDRETIQNAGPQINLSESLSRVPGLTILNRPTLYYPPYHSKYNAMACPGLAGHVMYCCGSPPMVAAVRAAAADNGLAGEDFHADVFVPGPSAGPA